MKVAVYSLTRDRLEFTQQCFQTLWDRSGYPYDHFVHDNGSEDGTWDWLRAHAERFVHLSRSPQNVGISKASNLLLDVIAARGEYALVVKYDNDCEAVTDGFLGKLVECFEDTRRFAARMALSPRVEGIIHQPRRIRFEGRGGHRIGLTGIIGGLCQAVPWEVYQHYRFPETLPLARGQDDHFSGWLIQQGVMVGYVEDMVVRHFLGTEEQARRLPDYFHRKWQEEQTAPGP